MGAPKTKWSHEEEDALRKGVKKFGAGKWRLIQKDAVLGAVLSARSNVDLKDKWRNMYPHSNGDAQDADEDRRGKKGDEDKGSSDSDRAPTTKSAGRFSSKHEREGKRSKGGDSSDGAPSGGGRSARKREKDAARVKEETIKPVPSAAPPVKKDGGDAMRNPKKKHKAETKDGIAMKGGSNGEPCLFLVNGTYRTAEEVTRDAARAVKDAERAAAAAEQAAEEAEVCEREAWEAERLANELLEEAERQKMASEVSAQTALNATRAGAQENGPTAKALYV